jgi:hypothetical protein
MDPAKYEYQSDFAKQYIALGKEEGRHEGSVQGRAELVSRLLVGFQEAGVRDSVSLEPPQERIGRCAATSRPLDCRGTGTERRLASYEDRG